MAVIINDFEAVAEPAERKGDAPPHGPPKLEPAVLRPPLRRLEARARRLKAH